MRRGVWALTTVLFGATSVACGGSGASGAPKDAGSEPPVDLSACTSQELPFYVFDAEYSEALERIVAFDGKQLDLLDPTTLQATAITLPVSGPSDAGALSLAPDGLTAAVAVSSTTGEDRVFVVDLMLASVTAAVPTGASPGDVVMSGNAFAYLIPGDGQQIAINIIDVARSVDHTDEGGLVTAGSFAKLHPDGDTLYVIEKGTGAPVLGDISLAQRPLGNPGSGPNESGPNGDGPCGDLWISDDGEEIFTGCGTIQRAAPHMAGDAAYLASLAPIPNASPYHADYVAMALDRAHDRVYAQPGPQAYTTQTPPTSQVEVFGYSSHAVVDELPIPCLAHDSKKLELQGRFVFAPAAGSRVYTLGLFAPAGLFGIASFERQ